MNQLRLCSLAFLDTSVAVQGRKEFVGWRPAGSAGASVECFCDMHMTRGSSVFPSNTQRGFSMFYCSNESVGTGLAAAVLFTDSELEYRPKNAQISCRSQ